MSKPRPPSRPSPRTLRPLDLADLVRAYVADCRLERSRRYLLLGRRLADRPIEALNEAWVETYRAARGAGEDDSREDELQDLRCEFDLRGVEPPMHRVTAEANRFAKSFKRRIRESPVDPDAVAEMEETLERLRDRLQAPKH